MAAALHLAAANFVVDLHPSKSGALLEGVREHLNTQLLRWSDDLQGVVLAYADERISSKEATVCYWYPLVRVEAAAHVLLFKPQVGQPLVGVVNKVGSDYLGLLVCGVFNVAIGVTALRPEFVRKGEAWASSKEPRHVLQEGSVVRFVVEGIEQEGFFTLRGSLHEPWTGDVDVVPPPSAQGAGSGKGGTDMKKQKKKKKRSRDEGGGVGTPSTAGSDEQKRKKKKQKKGTTA